MYSVCKISQLNSQDISFTISKCLRQISFCHKDKTNTLTMLPVSCYFLVQDNDIMLCMNDSSKFNKRKKFFAALSGTYKSLCNNAIYGLIKGYSVALYVTGVGYKATLNNDRTISFALRFSHTIRVHIHDDVHVKVSENGTIITITGHDKHSVTSLADKFVRLRKRSPYKRAGIYYANETVIIKSINKK